MLSLENWPQTIPIYDSVVNDLDPEAGKNENGINEGEVTADTFGNKCVKNVNWMTGNGEVQ